MPISIQESESTRKSIDVDIMASATGIAISGSVRWFNDLYEIPATAIPCTYINDAHYEVALCSTPPRLVLVEDGAEPSDKLCYLARWAFTKAPDTCASVTVEVPRRVIVPEPSTFRDEPRYTRDYRLDDAGAIVFDEETGEPLFDLVPIEPERIEIPPDPLPEPTVHSVSAIPILPSDSAEKTASRKRRRRIRELSEQIKGKSFATMSAKSKDALIELVALERGWIEP